MFKKAQENDESRDVITESDADDKSAGKKAGSGLELALLAAIPSEELGAVALEALRFKIGIPQHDLATRVADHKIGLEKKQARAQWIFHALWLGAVLYFLFSVVPNLSR